MFLKKRKETIKFLMKKKRFNQKKIAKKLNLSESYITRLINGERYSAKFEIFIMFELGLNYRQLI
jgi:transcriptional regulator with XRE-family HTH domain